jgi:glucosamine kinase
MSVDELALCIDIGKSGSRARMTGTDLNSLVEHSGLEPESAGRSGAGQRLLGVTHGLWAALEREVGTVERDRLRMLIIGSTSIPAADEVEALLDGARRDWPLARMVLTEDGVLGHAAAVGGPGNYVSVGTGVIGYGLDGDGTWYRKDGWGPDLGDRGSAVWLGRAGFTAALRAADGAGPETALRLHAAQHLGGMDHAAAARLAARTDRTAAIAAFARIVCGLAATDSVAQQLVVEAAAHVVETAAALVRDTGIQEVAVGGRLSEDPAFRASLDSALSAAGIRRTPVTAAPWDAAPETLFTPAYAAAAVGIRPEARAVRGEFRPPQEAKEDMR